MKELTVKQRMVFNAIKEFIDKNSFPPTCNELKNMLGYSSPNSITDHLGFIEKKGYIRRTTKIARSIVVLQE